MGSAEENRPLGLAIRLRLATREALDRDDWRAAADLNRAADAAYMVLSVRHASLYLDWVRDDIIAGGFIGSRGDA